MEGLGDTWAMPADVTCDVACDALDSQLINQSAVSITGGRIIGVTHDSARERDNLRQLRERMIDFAIRNGAHTTAKNIVEQAAAFEAFVLNGTNNASTPSG